MRALLIGTACATLASAAVAQTATVTAQIVLRSTDQPLPYTNNHCFFYAGQTRQGADSVIQVDFEPVPWLDKDVDIKGSMYLRVDSYELVETVTKLNKVPAQFRRGGLLEHSVRMRFSEIVNGITVPEDWNLTNRFRPPRSAFVELGQVFNLTWADSSGARP